MNIMNLYFRSQLNRLKNARMKNELVLIALFISMKWFRVFDVGTVAYALFIRDYMKRTKKLLLLKTH